MQSTAKIIITATTIAACAWMFYIEWDKQIQENNRLRLQIKNHKQVADAAAEQCWDDAVFRGFRARKGD